MATQDPTRSSAEDHASEDLRTERAVLAFLLDQHPTRLAADEGSFALDAKDFAEKDAIARAVRELTAAGLVRADNELISPTRAAIHFERLEQG
jgi:hypothetical protein